jgi:hypothetical protein
MGKQAIVCPQTKISRCENLFHALSSCSLEDSFSVEKSKNLLHEDNMDDFQFSWAAISSRKLHHPYATLDRGVF